MKVKTFLFGLLASFCLLACDKDNEPTKEEPTPDKPTPKEEEPVDTTYCEPVLAWYEDPAYVMVHQRQGTLVSSEMQDGSWCVTYSNARHYHSIMYLFSNNKLMTVIAEIERKQEYKTELLDYLDKHYTPLKTASGNQNYVLFLGADGKKLDNSNTVVGLTELGGVMKQMFVPVFLYQQGQIPLLNN
jgi:hypothetical protein